jgi:ABC-type nitrate/sulfonate/bicarbonate transport system permease component
MVTFGIRGVALPGASLVALIAALEALKRANALPVFVPAPSAIFRQVYEHPAVVVDNLLPSLHTATTGYLVAVIVTLAIACFATLVRSLREPVYSFGVFLNAIPIIASAPLLALWLGNGPRMQIVIAALATQFPILVGAIQGLSNHAPRERELMHVLCASRWQTFRYLRLPMALPYIFTGLKIAAPLAVLGTITAEWAGADRGIGAMMLYALFSYDTVTVWLSVLLCCLVACAAYGLVSLLEWCVVPSARIRGEAGE